MPVTATWPRPAPHPTSHPLTEEERHKIKSGEHAVVGCWVEDQLVVRDGPIRRHEDGTQLPGSRPVDAGAVSSARRRRCLAE